MPAGPDVSDRLFNHALGTRFEDLPAATIATTRRQILDYLGVAVAGIDAEGCRAVHQMVMAWGGAPTAQLIGYGEKVPAPMAALVNGATGRALELDDVHEQALTHSTVTMVPVALAVGATQGGLSGRDLITAVALGNDLAVRLAIAVRQPLGDGTASRTMSLTYQTATLAGSVVAAKVAGATKDLMADTFGSAYSQLAGNLQGLKEGTLGVRVQQGIASFAAVLAWELARRGISGGRQNLEGGAGWFNAFHGGRFNRPALLDGLGSMFRGDEISVKPYACCKYGHNAISAVAQATALPGFDASRVARIKATIYTQDMWDLLCEPLSVKAAPESFEGPAGVAMAQFSLPYMLAAAAARGTLTTAELTDEARRDPLVMDLMRRVEIINMNKTFSPQELPEPATVTLVLDDGTELSGASSRPIGNPENPMTDEQVVAKFGWCAERLPPDRRQKLVERAMSLETVDDVQDLVALTVA
ncbi:MmgE/PrpD family protein [Phytohabitans suffuscus]